MIMLKVIVACPEATRRPAKTEIAVVHASTDLIVVVEPPSPRAPIPSSTNQISSTTFGKGFPSSPEFLYRSQHAGSFPLRLSSTTCPMFTSCSLFFDILFFYRSLSLSIRAFHILRDLRDCCLVASRSCSVSQEPQNHLSSSIIDEVVASSLHLTNMWEPMQMLHLTILPQARGFLHRIVVDLHV